ncbi:MAG: ABC transporter substrate-binding protein [Propionibacteriaceae bacterium]|jgi:ABC-type glycerol-3-phosphate transport system substrate-binding protein|nr:ABC transporter substrate-binding protein [Propionibacteriaceae bacterium]
MVTKWTKKIALLSAAAVALAGLAACADTSEGGGSIDPVTTEKATSGEIVWWGFTPGSPVNEGYIEAFNKEYPDIKVTWKQTSIEDYDAAIRPALGNTEGLDVYQLSAGSANGGAAVFGPNAIDLSAAVEQSLGADWKDQLSATGVNALTIDGELKALAAGAVFSGTIFINQDLFDKYSLKAPTNWDEWKSVCDTFKKNKVGCFIQGAGQGAFNIDTVHAIADNVAPGNFVKATKGELDWTDPSLVKAFELWKKLFDEGIMQDGALGQMQYPEAHNGFMSGKYAMVMMGTWYLQFLSPDVMKAAMEGAGSTDEPFTMMPIYFPDIAGTGHTGSLFGDVDYGQAVSINSQNKGPATTFALWLGTSDAGQQAIADSLNLIPALKKITPDWNNVKLVNEAKQAEPTKALVQAASAVTDAPRFATINADMNQALMDALAEIAAGKATPQQAAETLKTQQETVG